MIFHLGVCCNKNKQERNDHDHGKGNLSCVILQQSKREIGQKHLRCISQSYPVSSSTQARFKYCCTLSMLRYKSTSHASCVLAQVSLNISIKKCNRATPDKMSNSKAPFIHMDVLVIVLLKGQSCVEDFIAFWANNLVAEVLSQGCSHRGVVAGV